MTSKHNERRKPDVRTQSEELFGLRLEGYFAEPPADEYRLVRPIVERMLCAYHDPRLRALYREQFTVPSSAAIPNIPTDSMLAELTDTALSTLTLASTSGALPELGFTRGTGRGRRWRESLDFRWMSPSRASSGEGWLTLFVCINDLPAYSRDRIESLADDVMRACGEAGSFYAWYDWEVIRTNSPDAESKTYPPRADTLAELERGIWHRAPSTHATHIPRARWGNLLTSRHLSKLGGLEHFRRDVDVHARRNSRYAPPIVELLEGASLLLRFPSGLPLDMSKDDHPLLTCDRFWWLEEHEITDEWMAWFQCKLGQAGLLLCQAPEALAAMESIIRDAPPGPPADLEELREEHSRASADFIDALWNSPPTLLGTSARPLSNRSRSAISRSRGGHGQQMTAFDIRKPGSDAPYGVWGCTSNYTPLGDPVYIGGPTEKAALCVFDASRHGWDGEHGFAPKRRPRTPEAYHCQHCGHDRFRCRALFEYGDPDDFQDPHVAERPQDFFSWFSLVATCAQCGRKKELLSVECA